MTSKGRNNVYPALSKAIHGRSHTTPIEHATVILSLQLYQEVVVAPKQAKAELAGRQAGRQAGSLADRASASVAAACHEYGCYV